MKSKDNLKIKGFYIFECYDKDGNLKWTDRIDNLVTTVGKNALLDAGLAGAAYTVTGPFMGLISIEYSTTDIREIDLKYSGVTFNQIEIIQDIIQN